MVLALPFYMIIIIVITTKLRLTSIHILLQVLLQHLIASILLLSQLAAQHPLQALPITLVVVHPLIILFQQVLPIITL